MTLSLERNIVDDPDVYQIKICFAKTILDCLQPFSRFKRVFVYKVKIVTEEKAYFIKLISICPMIP